jgi:probable F420-dependent oxidoreductase
MPSRDLDASQTGVKMKFMFQYPDVHGSKQDLLDAGPIGEVAVAAENAGFEGFALTEHPAAGARWLNSGGHQTLDPFVALGGVATVTSRLRLLTYLAVLPYRNPMLLAKAAMTVDRLSNGRFILGAGNGYMKAEFSALGVEFEERSALFEETLDVLPLHWSGEPFDYEGEHFSARGIQALPRPAQNPIPIWIGGNSKAARRRVTERAQGWMPLVAPAGVGDEMYKTTRTSPPGSPEVIRAQIQQIKDDGAGRSVDFDFTIAYVDPTISKPREDVERHRETFARLAEDGFTWVVVSRPTAPKQEIFEFLADFGEVYIQS